MNTRIFKTRSELFTELVQSIKSTSSGQKLNIGLATGNTMVPFYEEYLKDKQFCELHTYFQLDELLGIKHEDPRSYYFQLQSLFFSHLSRTTKLVYPASASKMDLDHYEMELRATGGLDIQLLGIGINGHVGLNEPGVSIESRVHVAQISPEIRELYKPLFPDGAPKTAITMGIQNILEAKKIILVAIGKSKAEIMKKFFEQNNNPQIPATLLKDHAKFDVYLDQEAASLL